VTGPGLPTGSGNDYGANYAYLTGTDFVQEIAFRNDNPNPLAKTVRQFENTRDLVDYVEHVWRPGDPNQATISKYDYTSDSLARRTNVQYSGVAFGSPSPPISQTLGYNDRNELTGSTRAGHPAFPFVYLYDPIGNRLTMVENAPPETTNYERNSLNQYPRATTERGANDLGQGYRYDADGNLIEAYVAADMNCDGVLNNFDIDALVLALTNLPGYYVQYPTCNHLNGDMNGDGLLNNWDVDLFTQYLVGHAGATGLRLKFGWDAENRLTLVEPLAPLDGDKKLTFAYDYLGRRVEKKVFVRTGGQWPANANEVRRFLWAGWLTLMELDGLNENALVRKYTWGLDLAGLSEPGARATGLEGAGGIGGLLAVEDVPLAASYVYTYDANGNVGQVLDLAAANAPTSIKAHYDYDPYGYLRPPFKHPGSPMSRTPVVMSLVSLLLVFSTVANCDREKSQPARPKGDVGPPTPPTSSRASNLDLRMIWEQAVDRLSPNDKGAPEKKVDILTSLLRDRVSTAERDREFGRLLATCGGGSMSSFDGTLAQSFVDILLEERDRDRLATLLAHCCPGYVGMSPIEFYLANYGQRFMADPILVLIDAYERSEDAQSKETICAALRRGFRRLRGHQESDPEFIRRCKQWYVENRSRVRLNPDYGLNRDWPTGEELFVLEAAP